MSGEQQADGEQLVDFYLSVAVRTSAGPGPGHKRLPAAEAARLHTMKHGCYGTEPPVGYLDGGAPPAYQGMMPR